MMWPPVPLKELLLPHEDWVKLSADEEYKQITVRMWGKGLALRGKVKGAEIAAASQNRVAAGNFLISKIDARHGAFGIVPDDLNGGVVSTDFPAFTINEERVAPELLKWITQTPWFIALCKRASKGSTNRVRLNETRFLAQGIPLPPRPLQKEIVKRLSEIEDRLSDQRKRAVARELDLAALLKNTFSSLIETAPREPMSEVAPLVRRPVDVEPDGSYPEVGVRSFGKGTFHKPALSGIEVANKRLFEVHEDDLVFNIVFAWEGAIAVAANADHGRVGSHRFLTCVPDPKRATAAFLRYYFLTSEGLGKIGEASPGGAGRNRTLGLKALDAIRVPVPSLPAQQWFDRMQAKVARIRELNALSSEASAALLPSLLDQALRGIDTPELAA